MRKVMQPFKAPRNTKEPSSPKFQVRPTRQSPRRLGNPDKDVANSEGETELVCTSWVIKETQETDIMQLDNESLAKTDCEEFNNSGERCSIKGPLSTNIASPNITEFEAFLEQEVATQRPLPNSTTTIPGKQKKYRQMMNSGREFWQAKSSDCRTSAMQH